MAHHHEADVDWAALGPMLEHEAEVRAPLYAHALRWLGSEASQDDVKLLVDVGAGPGVITCLIADTFPSAHVVALDGSPELLALTATRAARAGLADRVQTRLVDLSDGLDDLDVLARADVVWASQVVHHVGDQQHALRQVATLLRPGGFLGLAEGGLPMRTLPRDLGIGRPGLEARLDAANEAWFAEMRAALPNVTSTAEDWPSLLGDAGLIPRGSRTFLLDLPAPLGAAARELVRRRFGRSRETLSDHLDADDLAVLDQLLEAGGAHSLDHRADAFVLSATTVYLAVAPGT